MKSLIIFAGAGASRGVSAEKYPMALDFRKRLPDSVKNSLLYSYLNSFLEQSSDASGIDIEHILWELGSIEGALQAWSNDKSFAAYMLKTNQIDAVTTRNISGPGIAAQFEAFGAHVKRLQHDINQLVYDYYAQLPSSDELASSWLPLLQHAFSAQFNRIEIVTTNYDLVIESALENFQDAPIKLGKRVGPLPRIDVDMWRGLDGTEHAMLTKLHGSVDWKLGNGSTEEAPVIRFGHPEFDGDHDKRMILYPGFKGIPNREPFRTFHEHFRRALKTTTHALFIGFAFRDDYINDLISANLPTDSRIAVLNPAPLPQQLDFLKNATHWNQGFGSTTPANSLDNGETSPFPMDGFTVWANQ